MSVIWWFQNSDLVSDDDLSNEALQQYYDENQSAFLNPERIVAEYVVLEPADFVVSVDEAVVRDQFESVKDEYEVAEQAPGISHSADSG